MGLQLQVGHDMGSVKDSMKSMEDDVSAVKHGVKAVEEGMNLYRQASQAFRASNESIARNLMKCLCWAGSFDCFVGAKRLQGVRVRYI